MITRASRLLEIAVHNDLEIIDRIEFTEKFGFIRNDIPTHLTTEKACECVRHLDEELNELKGAIGVQDLAEIADALIDLVYLIKGMAVMMGLPWQELWLDVHRANMEKVRGVREKRNQAIDVIKPEGWVGPHTYEILVKNGYRKQDFFTRDGVFCEDKAHDDRNAVQNLGPLREDLDL